LNFCYYHIFPMKHFLHLNKIWTIFHFMCIQTIDVACMKMSYVVFDYVVLLSRLPIWYPPPSFCMSPHCDYSFHNLCNIYHFFLYYSMLLVVFLV
jgi:hypothetical protein